MGKITKKEAQKFLSDVPEEFVFYCQDGRTIHNLKELQDALVTMTDDTYLYHSNSEKKDFSNWVWDIIGDQKLARDLNNAKSRAHAVITINQRVVLLEDRLQK